MKIQKINVQSNFGYEIKQNQKTSSNKAEYSNNMELSNACYKPLSFGRRIEEHRSWGARINPETKEVSFKILTFPDARDVKVLIGDKSGNFKNPKEIWLDNRGGGVFEKWGISPKEAKNGDKYLFEITKNDGSKVQVKDPYAFKQDEVNGASTLYDHSKFKWQNDLKWQNNPDRISRTSDARDGKSSVQEARIYALNPDTITDERSYEGVISKFKKMKEMGFNAVEVMHVENTFDCNWGYDGVDKHAPSSYLGGPDGLKKLVDSAHKEGLNVIFDIIPNHIGPDGNQLGKTGPYVKGPNAFGDAINYEGNDSYFVRDFMINAAMNWAENYHIDGLRLDMTKYMESDLALKQLAAEMNYHHPDVFLIAEDGRGGMSVDVNGNFWQNPDEPHDNRVVNPLMGYEYGEGKSQDEHAKIINDIATKEISKAGEICGRLGMNSEWDFNFYHELDESLYSPDIEGLSKAILHSQNRVKYVNSHDEIGNFEGTRKIAKLMVPKLHLNDCTDLSSADVKRAKEYAELKDKSFDDAIQIVTFQKAQFASEALATKLQKGELDQYEITPETTHEESREKREKFYYEVLSPLGIAQDSGLSLRRIKRAFEQSVRQNKMAIAFTYGIPGPKMVFQGDENIDLTPFRFFRKFESVPHEEYLYTEKGYEPGESALEDSTMGKIEYSPSGKKKMDEYAALVSDLNKLNAENPAMNIGHINSKDIVEHETSSVVAYNAKSQQDDNEIFVVTNFSETNYREEKDKEYRIPFPKGQWVEILNTDDPKYGGLGTHLNRDEIIHGDGHSNKPLNISGYSTIYFKRVG